MNNDGYDNTDLTYIEKNMNTDEEKRKIRSQRKRSNRRVLWFSPPWNNQVLIGVGTVNCFSKSSTTVLPIQNKRNYLIEILSS